MPLLLSLFLCMLLCWQLNINRIINPSYINFYNMYIVFLRICNILSILVNLQRDGQLKSSSNLHPIGLEKNDTSDLIVVSMLYILYLFCFPFMFRITEDDHLFYFEFALLFSCQFFDFMIIPYLQNIFPFPMLPVKGLIFYFRQNFFMRHFFIAGSGLCVIVITFSPLTKCASIRMLCTILHGRHV